MVEHSSRGAVDVFWMVGGNFLETLPDLERSREALRRPRLRVHQDIVVSSSMLVDDGDVLLAGHDPIRIARWRIGTSTERRIIFSPEVPGRRIGSAKPEWWVFREVMARLDPSRSRSSVWAMPRRFGGRSAHDAVYARHRDLGRQRRSGVQWGGRRCMRTAVS
jgi:anaerobic selenocysteine-containing dehydrogenase